MIFPSYVFLLAFLPCVLIIWLSRLDLSWRLTFLTVASYVFYGWWDYRFTALMLISTLVDYYCGRRIHAAESKKRRKFFLLISIGSNLALLGYFKYVDFFLGSADSIISLLGLEAHVSLMNIILPIGISFYTFQSMSYSLDIYRNKARPAPDFLHFAAYVSLFPQLVAGPIVRYQDMADQIAGLRGKRVTSSEMSYGIFLFVMGMGKKLILADRLAPAANQIFDGTGAVPFVEAWWGSLSYTFQLYFDFSGYSDMAMGLGLMLGFRFPINFNSPYKSRSASEFWNRWHISLSHFLRDYLYIPLGGSREGWRKTIRNLVVTMGLGGLWHGASWTFVIWGLYHGVLLAVHNTAVRLGLPQLPKLLAIFSTFMAVHLGWVLFRAPDFSRAVTIYEGLFDFSALGPALFTTYQSRMLGELPLFLEPIGGPKGFLILAIPAAIAFLMPNSHQIKDWHAPRWAIYTAIVGIICMFSLSEETPFLYFQF